LERIKKAIEDYIATKEVAKRATKEADMYRSWGESRTLSFLQNLLRGLEDRCCRTCWNDLMNALHTAGLKDSSILKKVEGVLSDPELQLIVEC
jgi:hypothetical protein